MVNVVGITDTTKQEDVVVALRVTPEEAGGSTGGNEERVVLDGGTVIKVHHLAGRIDLGHYLLKPERAMLKVLLEQMIEVGRRKIWTLPRRVSMSAFLK